MSSTDRCQLSQPCCWIIQRLLPTAFAEEAILEIEREYLLVLSKDGTIAARKYLRFEVRALIVHHVGLPTGWTKVIRRQRTDSLD